MRQKVMDKKTFGQVKQQEQQLASQKPPGCSPESTDAALQKKNVLKIFVLFTGKHLCWSLFLIKECLQLF